MTKTGNTLNVGTASSSRIVVNADDIDLASGIVTIGTYKSVTVDTYGRVTAGTNPTTLSGFGITDTYTKAEIDSIFGSTTSASGYATTTLGYLNSFRGQYYGALSADPTLDPVGNAPTTGDLYFNSSSLTMRVYDGSAWLAAYLPTSGYLALSGGTMTGAITFAGAQTWPTFNQNTTGTAAGLSATLVATSGGTGQASYAVGDLLYASTTTALSKLADVATGNALISGGVGVAPSWGKIALATHVSGTLPIANGGTNGTATPTAGTVAYGTGTAFAFTAAGTTGQALLSNGSSAPSWGTAGVSAGKAIAFAMVMGF
jgi:hypothetical protein